MPQPQHHLLDHFTRAIQRHTAAFLVFFLALTALGAWGTTRLRLEPDFKELLPPDLQSVKDLEYLNERTGGVSNFIVVVEGEDLPAMQRYADSLVETLEREVPERYIRYIDYRNSDQRQFFETNKYLYAEVGDLEAIHERLKRKIEFEITCKNAFFLDFTGQCEKDPGFDMADVQKKYKEEAARYDQYKDGYYTNETGTLLAILIKPRGDSSAITQVREFLGEVLPRVSSIDPTSFHPSLRIHYTGSYAQADEEFSTTIVDARTTGALCLALVALVLFLYYRNVRMLFFITASVLCGMAWTYGLAYLLVGILTSQTALMGTIILGNGINNAIIFLARYLEEKKKNRPDLEEALCTAARTTVGATFTAAFTTAAAFATLQIADMRGYQQFGVIGSIGMVFCWVSAYTVLPTLVALGERIWPLRPKAPGTAADPLTGTLTQWIGRLVGSHPRRVAWAGLALTLAGVAGSARFWADPYEHDYSNIRSARAVKNGTGHWNKRLMDEVFDLSLTPNVIIAESRQQADQIRQALLTKRDTDPGSVIDTVRTFDSFVPERQEEKIEWMGKIQKLFEGQAVKFLTKDQRAEIDAIKRGFDLVPITETDVPESVRRHFVEKDGTLGRLVYVFPKNTRYLWIVENILKFSQEIRHTALPSGVLVTTSGEGVIFADIVWLVQRDAPRVILLALGSIFMLLLLKFRSLTVSTKVLLPLLAAYSWLGLSLWLFGVRITFLNFFVLPMALGIGMDYSANVFHRYELEGEGSIEAVLRSTGGAVLLCSLTTTIGYAALLIAQSQAMVSFGRLGLLSELCTLSAALILAPAVLILLERRRAGRPQAPGEAP